jgi:hypothetical protein
MNIKAALRIPGLSFLILLFGTCGVMMLREITCRDVTFSDELYWFPVAVGDSVVFITSDNMRMTFHTLRMKIWHTTRYTSDTGCKCEDESSMLLTNGHDSICFVSYGNYIYDEKATEIEDVMVKYSRMDSYFNEKDRTYLSSYTIDNQTFQNVKVFEKVSGIEGNIRKIFMAKNVGIIRIEIAEGSVWTISDLNPNKTLSIDAFELNEQECE